MKITTLVENSISTGLAPLMGEHGLSFFIETENRKILFDTGKGLTLLSNADALGINLKTIDTVVLSHGHYDHAGGLKYLIKRNNSFTVIAHPQIFDNKLVLRDNKYHSIGIHDDEKILVNSGIKIKLEKEPVSISGKIITTGEIPMETDFEDVEPIFYLDKNGNKTPDTIIDDRSLILDTKKGMVIIFGCAHRGIINTLKYATKLTGNKKVHAILGGLHLMSANDEKLKKIFRCLKDYGIEKMILGHCTGFYTTARFVNEFGDKIIPNTVGHIVEF
jgi:7,8-dihydropterin-6-yl-methyl-4-(beta-D-ribofuranosyl)aminobenzene 5'-phosphate synthase